MSIEVLTPESTRWDEFADRLFWIITADGNPRCDGDQEPNVHRYAKQIMTEMGNVDIPASIAFFEEHGGYCDCEILLNVDPEGRIWSGAPTPPAKFLTRFLCSSLKGMIKALT